MGPGLQRALVPQHNRKGCEARTCLVSLTRNSVQSFEHQPVMGRPTSRWALLRGGYDRRHFQDFQVAAGFLREQFQEISQGNSRVLAIRNGAMCMMQQNLVPCNRCNTSNLRVKTLVNMNLHAI